MGPNAGRVLVWTIIIAVLAAIGYIAYDEFYAQPVSMPVASPNRTQSHLLLPEGIQSLRCLIGLKAKQGQSWDGSLEWKDALSKFECQMEAENPLLLMNHKFKGIGITVGKAIQPLELKCNYTLTGQEPRLLIKLGENDIEVDLRKLETEKKISLQDGNVLVESVTPNVPLQLNPKDVQTNPFLSQNKKGQRFLIWREFHEGVEVNLENVRNGSFFELKKPDEKMTIHMSWFTKDGWLPAEKLTPDAGKFSDPVVICDGKGRLWAAWFEKVEAGFLLTYRFKSELENGSWSEWSVPSTQAEREAVSVSLSGTEDKLGQVWLGWTVFNETGSELKSMVLGEERHPFSSPRKIADIRPVSGAALKMKPHSKEGIVAVVDAATPEEFDSFLTWITPDPAMGYTLNLPSRGQAHSSDIAHDEEGKTWIVASESLTADRADPIGIPHAKSVRTYVHGPEKGMIHTVPDVPLPVPQASVREARIVLQGKNQPMVIYQSCSMKPNEGWIWYTTRLSEKGWSVPAALPFLPEMNATGTMAITASEKEIMGVARVGTNRPHLECWLKKHESGSSASLTKLSLPPNHQAKLVTSDLIRHFANHRSNVGGIYLRWCRGAILAPPTTPEQEILLSDLYHWSTRHRKWDWIAYCEPQRNSAFRWYENQEQLDKYSESSLPVFLRGFYHPIKNRNFIFLNALKSELPLPLASTINLAKGFTDKPAEAMLDEKLTSSYVIRDGIAGLEWTEEFLPAAKFSATTDGETGNTDSEFVPLWKPGPDSEATVYPYAQMVVVSPSLNAGSILDAIKSRHFYICSSDIFLDFRCNTGIMGDHVETILQPLFKVHAMASDRIRQVELYRDNKLIHVKKGESNNLSFDFRDESIKPLESFKYTIRVIQKDGNEAVSQPIVVKRSP